MQIRRLISASLLFINTDQISVEPCRTTELGSATAVQRNSGRARSGKPTAATAGAACHSLLHAMPCSIRAQARSLTMGRHAAPLAQRQRDVALELAVASDRALDKLLLAFEPRCRVPSAGATRFAVLGPHPRAANVCRRRLQLLLPPRSCSANFMLPMRRA